MADKDMEKGGMKKSDLNRGYSDGTADGYFFTDPDDNPGAMWGFGPSDEIFKGGFLGREVWQK